MNDKNTIFKAILGGMAISFGGIVFLNSPDKVIGAILFSVGLFTVLTYGLNLYTGKVCYVFNRDREYLKLVVLTVLGNFIGCLIMGLVFPTEAASTMCQLKLENSLWVVLAKGAGCGVLMYVAVEYYLRHGKYLGVILAVPAFILSGFEHSIADMFYFASAGMFTVEVGIFILVVIAGNFIGCTLIAFVEKYLITAEEPNTCG